MSLQPICANHPCGKPGTSSCRSCRMVLYCGPDCQKTHWPSHKVDCKSELLKSTWRPQWDMQRRRPVFLGQVPDPSSPFFSGKKHLWGTMPAYDVVNLPENEGTNIQSDLELLFAASGDLENVFSTLVAIPSHYGGEVKIIVNDCDLDIVARNVIMLMLILVEKNPIVAAQNVVQLWYSAFITPSLMNTLKTDIEPLIRAVCTKVEPRSDTSLLGKTFEFPSGAKLRVLLKKQSWNSLLHYTKVPDVTMAKAQEACRAVMLAPSLIDYRDRAYYRADPPTRFGTQKFRERGVLMPLGASCDAFTHDGYQRWRLDCGERDGPLQRLAHVAHSQTEIGGQLYYHVIGLVADVHKRLPSIKLSTEMMQLDTTDLLGHFGGPGETRFDRIQTCNITDLVALNPVRDVSQLGPLLKDPGVNPHATLITLFVNAVNEMVSLDHGLDANVIFTGDAAVAASQARHYLGTRTPRHLFDADITQHLSVMTMFRDCDSLFDKYKDREGFVPILYGKGMEIKAKNTIVDKWPLRMKKRPEEEGAKEEFQGLLNRINRGGEVYVEWRRRS
ncbi:hypothetical protein PG984_016460 [Apiospora sp. TS-2023a]